MYYIDTGTLIKVMPLQKLVNQFNQVSLHVNLSINHVRLKRVFTAMDIFCD